MILAEDYRQLLLPHTGSRFQWPGKLLREGGVEPFVRGAMEAAHKTWDGRRRPFGAALTRLMWEMSDITHEDDADKDLKADFIEGGDVRMVLTVGGPWGEYFVDCEDLDVFLSQAGIEGDGALSVQNFYDAKGLEAVGAVFERNLDLAWLGEPWRGNLLFGEGSGPGDGRLEIAFLHGGQLSIIDCGRPYFGGVPPVGVRWLRFDGLYWGLPAVFVMNGQRYYIPCSEPGGSVILSGAVSIGDDGVGALGSFGYGMEAPFLSVKLAYSPGWMRCDGVYPWSEMGWDAQFELRSQASHQVRV